MSYYLHLLCRRDGTALKGLTFDKETKTYISQAWGFRKEQANKLLGGTIFYMKKKVNPQQSVELSLTYSKYLSTKMIQPQKRIA